MIAALLIALLLLALCGAFGIAASVSYYSRPGRPTRRAAGQSETWIEVPGYWRRDGRWVAGYRRRL